MAHYQLKPSQLGCVSLSPQAQSVGLWLTITSSPVSRVVAHYHLKPSQLGCGSLSPQAQSVGLWLNITSSPVSRVEAHYHLKPSQQGCGSLSAQNSNLIFILGTTGTELKSSLILSHNLHNAIALLQYHYTTTGQCSRIISVIVSQGQCSWIT